MKIPLYERLLTSNLPSDDFEPCLTPEFLKMVWDYFYKQTLSDRARSFCRIKKALRENPKAPLLMHRIITSVSFHVNCRVKRDILWIFMKNFIFLPHSAAFLITLPIKIINLLTPKLHITAKKQYNEIKFSKNTALCLLTLTVLPGFRPGLFLTALTPPKCLTSLQSIEEPFLTSWFVCP